MTPRLIDVSHTVEHSMITYKGLPAPVICDFLSREASRGRYAPGTEFHIGQIEMVANTGTYVDSPFHRFADGVDLAGLPLTSLANLDALVVRVDQGAGRAVAAAAFAGLDLQGKAILVHTG
jgi:arylformamidase